MAGHHGNLKTPFSQTWELGGGLCPTLWLSLLLLALQTEEVLGLHKHLSPSDSISNQTYACPSNVFLNRILLFSVDLALYWQTVSTRNPSSPVVLHPSPYVTTPLYPLQFYVCKHWQVFIKLIQFLILLGAVFHCLLWLDDLCSSAFSFQICQVVHTLFPWKSMFYWCM